MAYSPSLNNRNFFRFLFLITAAFLIITGLLVQRVCAEYSRRDAVVKVVENTSSAVVNISSEQEVVSRINPFSGFGINPDFNSFFRDFYDYGYQRRFKRSHLGSGVIIDGKLGFILTNSHVIEEAGTITVTLKDEREFEARVVGADPDSDLAVLKIKSDASLPSIDMGDSRDLMIGETVIAIGNPFGFSNTVTTGVISAVNRSIRTEDRVYHQFIQTDASINPGNSGGPLLNINGDLIGINTAIYAKAQGIGFAIPINRAARIVSDLIAYGEVIRPWIGIVVQRLDSRMANYLNLSDNKGVVVKGIEKDSPAQKAGVREGDIIVFADNTKILSTEDYFSLIKNVSAGNSIKMDVIRNGKKKTFKFKTSVYPDEKALFLAWDLLGIRIAGRKKNSEGVIITEVDRKSYLYKIGAEPGDIIRQINDITIENMDSFKKAVIKNRLEKSVVILLQRGERGYYITIEL